MRIEVWDSRTKELTDTIFVDEKNYSYSLDLMMSIGEYPPNLPLSIFSDSGKRYVFSPQMLEHVYLVISRN